LKSCETEHQQQWIPFSQPYHLISLNKSPRPSRLELSDDYRSYKAHRKSASYRLTTDEEGLFSLNAIMEGVRREMKHEGSPRTPQVESCKG
jgi:hypothetical protein